MRFLRRLKQSRRWPDQGVAPWYPLGRNRHPTGTNARIIELYPHLVLTSHVPPIFLISGEVRDGSDAILVVGIFYPLASLEAVKCIHICSPFQSLSFGETCRTSSA